MTVNEHLWEFPHTMQLKVMGAKSAPLAEAVTEILQQHLDDFLPEQHLSLRDSSNGNYISISASVTVHNADQVKAIYAELHACEHVKIVL